jgi:hypothetical protein
MAARSRLEPNRQLVGISSLRIPALRFGDESALAYPKLEQKYEKWITGNRPLSDFS